MGYSIDLIVDDARGSGPVGPSSTCLRRHAPVVNQQGRTLLTLPFKLAPSRGGIVVIDRGHPRCQQPQRSQNGPAAAALEKTNTGDRELLLWLGRRRWSRCRFCLWRCIQIWCWSPRLGCCRSIFSRPCARRARTIACKE